MSGSLRWIVRAKWVERWATPAGTSDCRFAIAEGKPAFDFSTQLALENRVSVCSMSCFFCYEFLVVGGGEKAVKFAGIFQRHLQHPGAVGVFVDLLRRRRQISIHFRHSTGGRRKKVRHGLDRLHRAKRFSRREFGPDFRRFDKDDVSE